MEKTKKLIFFRYVRNIEDVMRGSRLWNWKLQNVSRAEGNTISPNFTENFYAAI